MKKVLSWIVFAAVIFFFLVPSSVFAAFSFDNIPSSINYDEEFSVSVTLSVGSSAGKSYYIRSAFSHSDSPSSYFGYIKNHEGAWYNKPTSNYSQYYKVTMDENNQWSGVVEVKIDTEDSYYKGSGEYNFKLGRYTEGGSLTWSDNTSSITIVAPPTSTPTPIPEPTNTPVPTPTRTLTPTKTPTPIKTPTPTPTTKPKSNPPTSTRTPAPTAVLGEKTEINTPTPTTSSKSQGGASDNLAKILIGLGVVFLGACGILVFRAYKEEKGIGL